MGRSWMSSAPCRDLTSEIEFLSRPAAFQRAVCDECPVWVECLNYAIETKATGVVMGGLEIRDKPLRKVAEEESSA